jgi:hypothetical protein
VNAQRRITPAYDELAPDGYVSQGALDEQVPAALEA